MYMKYVLFVIAMLLFLSTAHAALQDWKIDISLNDDKTSDWTVTYRYNDSVQKSDFFLLVGVTSFNVTADSLPVSCSIARGIGTSIVCNSINARTIVYSIKTFPVISSLENLNIFSSRFSVTQTLDRFAVIIRLPFGTALTESSKLAGTGLNPFEPPGATQGSDGRRIFVEWNFEKPRLGETADFTVVYEQVKPVDFNIFLAIIATIVIAFLAFLVFFFRSRRLEEVLPILTDSERSVMEIVLREKQVDQRKIVKETDFSKAKVSRIIQDLVKRGLIEKKPKGRTNIITAVKTRKYAGNHEKRA